ncbi:hypothetical protein [Desulfobacter sp. UBA2225]|uniref:hypothetical protein n=1 Tax=Desulfobacter sp. UBA2225 TaxID=1961413 RepID=UPI00257FAAB0|nr:hypothetical protein [Desulfobacter sp. UBA2225]
MNGKVNKHFNRIETGNNHWYMNNTGARDLENIEYAGFLKCKLVHGTSFSIVIPDLILLESPTPVWIQPLFFMPNIFAKMDNEIQGRFYVDISCSQTLQLDFANDKFVRRYQDGSELYRCQITGPKDLAKYSTGEFEWFGENQILLHLYHHTSDAAKNAILSSGRFKLSQWNIQGNKKLKNVGYVYLTCLPKVSFDGDLRMIAMASDGKICMIIDGVDVPPVLPPDGLGPYENAILQIPVYRESTPNRQSTIMLKVDAGFLAPQHILRHVEPNGQIYFEIPCPFVYRLGLVPGQQWEFDPDSLLGDYAHVKNFDYVVVGTATYLEGLGAPFDEENTKEIAKIQRTEAIGNILDFWFDKGNQDHFTGLDTQMQEFDTGGQ